MKSEWRWESICFLWHRKPLESSPMLWQHPTLPPSNICLPFLDEPHGNCATRQIGVITGSDGRGMKAQERESSVVIIAFCISSCFIIAAVPIPCNLFRNHAHTGNSSSWIWLFGDTVKALLWRGAPIFSCLWKGALCAESTCVCVCACIHLSPSGRAQTLIWGYKGLLIPVCVYTLLRWKTLAALWALQILRPVIFDQL